jgi:DNA-binding NarL/FixJ family response regulator
MIIKNALDPSQNPWDPFRQLTGMEKHVLRFPLKGHRSKEVANELSLHTSTVSLHKKRVSSKLGATNLPYLIDDNILDPLPAITGININHAPITKPSGI